MGYFSNPAFLNLTMSTFVFAQHQTGPLKVELILPATRNPKHPANICEVGPAIEWAMEHVKAQYRNELDLTFKYLEQPNVQSCEDLCNEMGDMLAKYIYNPRREKKVTVFGPFNGCIEAQSLLQMAASLNSLAILGVTTLDNSISTLYSNFILTSGLDMLSATTHFVVMLQTYRWTMCYMILDAGDTVSSSTSAGGLATVVAGVRAFGQAIGGTVVLRFIDSSKPQDIFDQNVRLLLQEVQVSARVLPLGNLGPDAVRRFMIVAYSANMTTGEYVYLGSNFGPEDPERGSITWQKNDADDEIVFQAYRSLLLQSGSLEERDNQTETFLVKLKERRSTNLFPGCNHTTLYKRDSAHPVTSYISTYILAQVLAQAINTSSPTIMQQLLAHGSATLVEYFRNRSFRTPAGKVSFDQTGARRSASSISQYDPTTRQITAIWKLRPFEYRMDQTREPFWLLGHAPPNSPLCGFRGELCHEHPSETTVQVASSVIAVVLLLVGTVITLERRRKRNQQRREVFNHFLLDAPLGMQKAPVRSLMNRFNTSQLSHDSFRRARLTTIQSGVRARRQF